MAHLGHFIPQNKRPTIVERIVDTDVLDNLHRLCRRPHSRSTSHSEAFGAHRFSPEGRRVGGRQMISSRCARDARCSEG